MAGPFLACADRMIHSYTISLRYAAFALVKIAHNAEIRKKITDEGGLEPVLFLSRTDDSEIWREARAVVSPRCFFLLLLLFAALLWQPKPPTSTSVGCTFLERYTCT